MITGQLITHAHCSDSVPRPLVSVDKLSDLAVVRILSIFQKLIVKFGN